MIDTHLACGEAHHDDTPAPAATRGWVSVRNEDGSDALVTCDNRERPHQALAMKVPADLYVRSPRVYRGLEELAYPFHDHTIAVTRCGQICFNGRKVNLSHVFAASVDRAKPAICRHFKTGHFR